MARRRPQRAAQVSGNGLLNCSWTPKFLCLQVATQGENFMATYRQAQIKGDSRMFSALDCGDMELGFSAPTKRIGADATQREPSYFSLATKQGEMLRFMVEPAGPLLLIASLVVSPTFAMSNVSLINHSLKLACFLHLGQISAVQILPHSASPTSTVLLLFPSN